MKNTTLALTLTSTLLLSANFVRAQVTNPPPAPPVVTCPDPVTIECTNPAVVTVGVSDADGGALTVIWTVNGTSVLTNTVPAGTPPLSTNLTFVASLPLGTNSVSVTAIDNGTNSASCATTVTVVDTIPPTIVSVSATPNVLWPPNHKWVTIHVSAVVTDPCDATTWKIISVASNEAVLGHGSGHTSPDWLITGDHTVQVRSERAGNDKSGRIYTITIQATDVSGNVSAPATVTVTVPHDHGHHNGQGNGNGNGNGHGHGH
ncbi:MAG: hypothetical protein C5B50_00515 [Verrucomicrobia bacterium]|nr:MAG: hypothetical protein C5B50_00515 [Verrucomicrobiota bacterium]